MTSSLGGNGQLDDGKLRLTEDDIARAELDPRGVPGKPDPARMTPQQAKKFPQLCRSGTCRVTRESGTDSLGCFAVSGE
jgi:hypothetical protein